MADKITFPATFKEFAEQYKIVDTNGAELIPIFRVEQWLDNENNSAKKIFEEIEKHFLSGTTPLGLSLYSIGSGTYIKLKKKYTESEKNDGN